MEQAIKDILIESDLKQLKKNREILNGAIFRKHSRLFIVSTACFAAIFCVVPEVLGFHIIDDGAFLVLFISLIIVDTLFKLVKKLNERLDKIVEMCNLEETLERKYLSRIASTNDLDLGIKANA